MHPLARPNRESVRPLYEDFPGLHGAIDSALEGVLGHVFADDPANPRVARIVIGDFHAIAGDPNTDAAADALLAVPDRDYIAIPESWREKLQATLPLAQSYSRFAMHSSQSWDRSHLRSLRESLPPDYTLHRIDATTVAAFRDLNETFVDNFDSLAHFLERGVGFGITKDGELVAGCSSYSISSQTLEFEIETSRDYQRRGLALVTGARMIEHCLDNGLEPCWDAAHEGSAVLAEGLGFVGRRQYTAYRLGPLEHPES